MTADTVVRQEIPDSSMAFFDGNGRVVAWSKSMQIGVHFASGEFVHLGSNGTFITSTDIDAEAQFDKTKGVTVSSFAVDPSGTFFVFAGMDHGTYLGKVAAASTVKCVSTNFSAKAVFYENGHVYVCGWLGHAKGKGARCLMLDETPDGFVIKKEFLFSGMNSVIDIDQSGSRVLLNEESDSFASLYVESLTTGKRVRIGWANKRVLFLKNNIIAP